MVYGLIPKTRTIYKVSDEIHKAINYCMLNRNEMEMYRYKQFRIIQNEPPGMASIQYAYTIYNTETKEFVLVVTVPFNKTYEEEKKEMSSGGIQFFNSGSIYSSQPKVYDLKHTELLSNELVFSKIHGLMDIQNPFFNIDNQINQQQMTKDQIANEFISLQGLFFSDQQIRYFKGKYHGSTYETFDELLNKTNKIEETRITTDSYFVLQDDKFPNYRIGQFNIEGPLFVFDTDSKKMEVIKCSWLKTDLNISKKYIVFVAKILKNMETMELYQNKYALYKKAQKLIQKYGQKIHGISF